jgi:hypothetical protein
VQPDLPEPLARAGQAVRRGDDEPVLTVVGQPPHGRTEVGGRPDIGAAGPEFGRGGAAAYGLGVDAQVGQQPLAGRAHVQRAVVATQLEAAEQSQVKADQAPA